MWNDNQEPFSFNHVCMVFGFMVGGVVAFYEVLHWMHSFDPRLIRWLLERMLGFLLFMVFAAAPFLGAVLTIKRQHDQRGSEPKVCADCGGKRVVSTCATDVTGLEFWPCLSCGGTWDDVKRLEAVNAHY